MTTFYIYEVQGHKVGATKNWEGRTRHNFNSYSIEPVLLETMEGPDIEEFWQVVGDREWELADEKGYQRGKHYRLMRLNVLKSLENNEGRRKAGAIAGPTNGGIAGRSQRHVTFKQAEEIRSKWNGKNRKELAAEYGCGVGIITGITSNRTYLKA